MADNTQSYPEIVGWLKESGYSQQEIETIVERVQAYEKRVGLDVFMASIGDGTFDLNQVIEQALKKAGGSQA